MKAIRLDTSDTDPNGIMGSMKNKFRGPNKLHVALLKVSRTVTVSRVWTVTQLLA